MKKLLLSFAVLGLAFSCKSTTADVTATPAPAAAECSAGDCDKPCCDKMGEAATCESSGEAKVCPVTGKPAN